MVPDILFFGLCSVLTLGVVINLFAVVEYELSSMSTEPAALNGADFGVGGFGVGELPDRVKDSDEDGFGGFGIVDCADVVDDASFGLLEADIDGRDGAFGFVGGDFDGGGGDGVG